MIENETLREICTSICTMSLEKLIGIEIPLTVEIITMDFISN